jgi:hypothetical protein
MSNSELHRQYIPLLRRRLMAGQDSKTDKSRRFRRRFQKGKPTSAAVSTEGKPTSKGVTSWEKTRSREGTYHALPPPETTNNRPSTPQYALAVALSPMTNNGGLSRPAHHYLRLSKSEKITCNTMLCGDTVKKPANCSHCPVNRINNSLATSILMLCLTCPPICSHV